MNNMYASASGSAVIPMPLPEGSNNSDDGMALELEPSFTTQDEQRDLASLSISDIVNLESDLRGIAAGVSGLRMDGGGTHAQAHLATAPSEMGAALSRLDEELSRLPASETAAYRRALKECPDQVSDERKMAFIEHENGDAVLAATRLAKYWESRLDLFGPERCFLPMTLAGAMKDEAANLISRRINQRMPVTDTAGRAVIYFCPSRRNFSDYSVEQEFMSFMYLLETVIEDADLRRRGFVALMDGRNIQRKHYNRKLKGLATMMESVLPIHFRAFHCCHPSKVFYYVIHPVVKHFLPKDMRLRLKLHYGPSTEVLRDLEGYCLPRDRLPTELGGDVVLDTKKWVMERMALESSRRAEPNISAPLTDDGPAAKRLRSDNGTEMLAMPVPSAPAPIPKSWNKQSGKGRGKGGGRGKLSDPRMTRAIAAKLSDADLPLYDALIAGGFVFRKDKGLVDMVDADGVTLTQRKNNLCRRIRKEKQKQAKRDSVVGSTDSGTSSNVASEQDRITSPMSTSPSLASAGASPALEEKNEANADTNSTKNDQIRTNGYVDGGVRRDSFYESIMELPGIEDMDMDDLEFLEENELDEVA